MNDKSIIAWSYVIHILLPGYTRMGNINRLYAAYKETNVFGYNLTNTELYAIIIVKTFKSHSVRRINHTGNI